MITTVAKAERLEDQPPFLEKFTMLDEPGSFYETLKKQGYTHYLDILPARVSVGSVLNEWRPLVSAVFFRGQPPAFDDLKEGRIQGTHPVIEERKFYAMMSGIGRGAASASLDAQEIVAWLGFFESKAGEVREL
jgi:hypothetical protein